MPDPVAHLRASPTPDGTGVVLVWSRPRESDVAGVVLLRKPDDKPVVPVDGDPTLDPAATLIYRDIPDDQGGLFAEGHVDYGGEEDDKFGNPIYLGKGRTYHYTAYTFDDQGVYSTPVTAEARPAYYFRRLKNFDLKRELYLTVKNVLAEHGYAGITVVKSFPRNPTPDEFGKLLPCVVVSRMSDNEARRFRSDEYNRYYNAEQNVYTMQKGSVWDQTVLLSILSLNTNERDLLARLLEEMVLVARPRFLNLGCEDFTVRVGQDDDNRDRELEAILYKISLYATATVPVIMEYDIIADESAWEEVEDTAVPGAAYGGRPETGEVVPEFEDATEGG